MPGSPASSCEVFTRRNEIGERYSASSFRFRGRGVLPEFICFQAIVIVTPNISRIVSRKLRIITTFALVSIGLSSTVRITAKNAISPNITITVPQIAKTRPEPTLPVRPTISVGAPQPLQ
jgi:hypothetical protein